MAIDLQEVKAQFDGIGQCETVSDGILKCVRTHSSGAKSALATYWVDAREKVPTTKAGLQDYQEAFFSREYYELPRYLQLNQYLFFLVDDQFAKRQDDIRAAKKIIETDISYARKFVFTVDGLRTHLARIKAAFGPPTEWSAPTEKWLTRLEQNGLHAIYENRPRAEVVRDIEEGRVGPGAMAEGFAVPPLQRRRVDEDPSDPLPPIKKIRLTNFGDFPSEPEYDLSAITLIFGPNASGKTSLLEGVEFALCGANQRGERKVKEGAPCAEVLIGGSDNYQRFGTTNQERLKLDLKWFGGYARRNARPEQGFNRYIFFNADSSYALQYGSDQASIAASINTLALGEEATVLWGRLNEYLRALEKSESSHRNLYDSAVRDAQSAENLIASLSSTESLLPEAFRRARDSLKALGARTLPEHASKIPYDFLDTVVKIADSFQRLASLVAWIPDPTLLALETRAQTIEQHLEKIKALLDQREKYQREFETIKTNLQSLEKRLAAMQRFKLYVQHGWRANIDEINRLEKSEAGHAALSSLVGQLDRNVLSSLDRSQSIKTLLESTTRLNLELTNRLTTKTKEENELGKQLSQLQNIRSGIKALARNYLDLQSHAKECPVCGTIFPQGVLEAKIDQDIEQVSQQESSLIKLKEEIQDIQQRLQENQALQAIVHIVRQIGSLFGQTEDQPIKDILEMLEVRRDSAQQDRLRLNGLRTLMRDLSVQGFSDSEFKELNRILDRQDIAFDNGNDAKLAAAIILVRDQLDAHSQRRSEISNLLEECSRQLNEFRSTYLATEVEPSDLHSYVSSLQQRVLEAQQLCSQMEQFVSIERNTSIREILLRALVAKDRVRDVLSVKEQEEKRKVELTTLQKRVAAAKENENAYKKKLDRVSSALEVLRDITVTESLDVVLKEFFDQNTARITELFSMIHSPREFEGIIVLPGQAGEGLSLQLKRTDGKIVDISQISTGQRSALALALYVVLNEKLRGGPQLMLFDEPVANVDDLNTLAFFDYLREVMLTRRRQIVYATANDKIAALFIQKFQFLGGDFTYKQLTRAPTVA